MMPTEIRALRERLQLTQQAFAERLGLRTRGAVCRLEKGSRTPNGPLLLLLQMLQAQVTRDPRSTPE